MVGVGFAPGAIVVGSLAPVLRRKQTMWGPWSVDCARDLKFMEEPIIVLDLPANCYNVGAWTVAVNSNDVDRDRIWRSEEVIDAVGYAL